MKTAEQVKNDLKNRYGSVSAWAIQNGYTPLAVSRVMTGVNKGRFGQGREIALKLGLIEAEQQR
jgi:gp16 family phage-associated protein